jgi:hypothetical protein
MSGLATQSHTLNPESDGMFSQHGVEFLLALLIGIFFLTPKSGTHSPPLSVRVNTVKTDRANGIGVRTLQAPNSTTYFAFAFPAS